MAKYKVVITDDRHVSYEIERQILSSIGAGLTVCDCVTSDEVAEACKFADGVLLNMAPMPEAVIQALEKCKVISRYGVGYDNVDVDACTRKSIQVANVPDYCMADVSEHAIALIMSCLRHVPLRDHLVRQGQWNIQAVSFRLEGKTLGVLGFGSIARTLVRKLGGMGFAKVMVYDPYVSEESCAGLGVTKATLAEVMAQSDVVSLHMPVTPETRGIINEHTLGLMKPMAILINSARGPLVDDAALVRTLQEKRILAAGLDTHFMEPLPKDSPYFALDNVVLTDHTAYDTIEAVAELKTKAAQNIVLALTGKPPIYPVNKI